MKQRRAFSLIEAAIVLALVGLVIGGIWAAASAVNQSNRINRTLEQVGQVVEKLRSKVRGTVPDFETFALYDNASCPPLVICYGRDGWSAMMPADMISATGDYPVNPFGHEYGISMTSDVIVIAIMVGDDVKACSRLGPLLYAAYNKETPSNGIAVDVTLGNSGNSISSPSSSGSNCQNELDTYGAIMLGFNIRA